MIVQPLGELEQAVMNVVWKRAPVTAREVCDQLKGAKARAYTTIMTTMDRLHKKGVLRREKDGIAWRYAPVLARDEHERALAQAMAAGLLRSHPETGLAAFVDAAARLDGALLRRLKQLIDRRRRGGSR